jgi:hypothetical protein
MPALGMFEPNEKSQQAMGGIAGIRFTPGMVFAVDGPDNLGPEDAGAVIVLHATLTSDEMAQTFYQKNADIMRTLRESPGFIRFMGVGDGLSLYGIGFWKTPETAAAFAKAQAHSVAVRDLNEAPYQYSQFAGIWAAHSVRPRRFFCDRCKRANAAPAQACTSCGNPLVDVFKEQAKR